MSRPIPEDDLCLVGNRPRVFHIWDWTRMATFCGKDEGGYPEPGERIPPKCCARCRTAFDAAGLDGDEVVE